MFLVKNMNVNNKLKKCKEKFIIIKKNLNIFVNIEILQKIGKDNDEYYIFPNNYYQTISRWWYSENREKTVTYLLFLIFLHL